MLRLLRLRHSACLPRSLTRYSRSSYKSSAAQSAPPLLLRSFASKPRPPLLDEDGEPIEHYDPGDPEALEKAWNAPELDLDFLESQLEGLQAAKSLRRHRASTSSLPPSQKLGDWDDGHGDGSDLMDHLESEDDDETDANEFPFPTELSTASWVQSDVNDPLRFGEHLQNLLSSILRRSGLSAGQVDTAWENLIKSQPASQHYSNIKDLLKSETGKQREYGAVDTLAMLKWRFHPSYVLSRRVLSELSRLEPDFVPRTMLDFGSGCGPASSAAFRVYNNSLTSFTGIDQSRSMRDGYDLVMKSLLESTYNSGLSRQASSSASFRKRKVMNRSDGYDLIVVSHVLLETPGEKVSSMIRDLWGILNEDGMLVVIEPGNPVGFKNVMQARETLLNRELRGHVDKNNYNDDPANWEGWTEEDLASKSNNGEDISHLFTDDGEYMGDEAANMHGYDEEEDLYEEGLLLEQAANSDVQVIAPCTHKARCPMLTNDGWGRKSKKLNFCSFTQPVVKSGEGAKKNEKLSYVVLRKGDYGEEEEEEGEEREEEKRGKTLRDLRGEGVEVEEEEEKEEEEVEDWLSGGDGEEGQIEMEIDDTTEEEEIGEVSASIGRIIRPPLKKKGHVHVDMCVGTRQGAELMRQTVTRKKLSKPAYKAARKSKWGGLFLKFHEDDDEVEEVEAEEFEEGIEEHKY